MVMITIMKIFEKKVEPQKFEHAGFDSSKINNTMAAKGINRYMCGKGIIIEKF